MTTNSMNPQELFPMNSSTMSVESWLTELEKSTLTKPHQDFLLKKLEDHPEWVHQKNQKQETPLLIAAKKSHNEIVLALIKAGADVNAQDENHWSALMTAVALNHREMFEELIKAGADIHAQDHTGWSVLMLAIYDNRLAMANKLMDLGVDVNVQNEEVNNA